MAIDLDAIRARLDAYERTGCAFGCQKDVAALLEECERLRAQESYDSVYFRCASDGEVAQQSGVTRDANPYRADDSTRGTLMDEAWDDGWCAADYERLAAENKRLREAVEFAVWSGNLSQLRKALGREDA